MRQCRRAASNRSGANMKAQDLTFGEVYESSGTAIKFCGAQVSSSVRCDSFVNEIADNWDLRATDLRNSYTAFWRRESMRMPSPPVQHPFAARFCGLSAVSNRNHLAGSLSVVMASASHLTWAPIVGLRSVNLAFVADSPCLGFSLLQPSCPGYLLRLNPRARLSPVFCFVGSPCRFVNIRQTCAPVPPTKHSGFNWERGRLLFGCPRNNGQQKRRTYMYTMNQLTIIGFTGNDAEAHYTQNGTLVVTLQSRLKKHGRIPPASGRANRLAPDYFLRQAGRVHANTAQRLLCDGAGHIAHT